MIKFLKAFAPKDNSAAIAESMEILAGWDREEPGQWMTEVPATTAERMEWVQGR